MLTYQVNNAYQVNLVYILVLTPIIITPSYVVFDSYSLGRKVLGGQAFSLIGKEGLNKLLQNSLRSDS